MGTTIFERSAPIAPGVIGDALASSRLGSFWLEDLGAPRFPRYAGEGRYDLVVVGGGYTGLWTALQAKQRNPAARIALLEAKTIGWAASGRNGGFCESTLTHGESNGESRFPGELAQLDRLGAENLDEIERTVVDSGWDCDFERTGSLAVATEEYQVEELREAHDGVNELFFDAAGIRAQLDSPTYLAGLWSKRATAMIHPGKLARELAIACADAGVELFEKSPALALEVSDAAVVRTGHGTVTADRVALATNAFPSLLKRFQLHTVPVYDYVLMTEPLSAAQLASIGWGERQGVSDVGNQFHYYRLTADNRILWGGYDAIYHYGGRIRPEYDDRRASFEKLASHFFTTFPQLEGVRFSHRWGGVIDTSTRFCAFFGRAHGGRVSYAAGFTGLGVAATRFAANVMLDHLAGLKTERTSLKMVRSIPLPFPPEPAAYLGVQATRWALDRADHNGGKRNLLLKILDAAGLGSTREPGAPRARRLPNTRLLPEARSWTRLLRWPLVIDHAAALAIEVAHTAVPASQVVAGSPSTGYVSLGELDGQEYGVWEMTPGAMRDVEADELFVVLFGEARLDLVDDGTTLMLSAGSVARLSAGMHTVWTVAETLRKVYVTPAAG